MRYAKPPTLAGNGGNRFHQLLRCTPGNSLLSRLNPLPFGSSVINWLESESSVQTSECVYTGGAAGRGLRQDAGVKADGKTSVGSCVNTDGASGMFGWWRMPSPWRVVTTRKGYRWRADVGCRTRSKCRQSEWTVWTGPYPASRSKRGAIKKKSLQAFIIWEANRF